MPTVMNEVEILSPALFSQLANCEFDSDDDLSITSEDPAVMVLQQPITDYDILEITFQNAVHTSNVITNFLLKNDSSNALETPTDTTAGDLVQVALFIPANGTRKVHLPYCGEIEAFVLDGVAISQKLKVKSIKLIRHADTAKDVYAPTLLGAVSGEFVDLSNNHEFIYTYPAAGAANFSVTNLGLPNGSYARVVFESTDRLLVTTVLDGLNVAAYGTEIRYYIPSGEVFPKGFVVTSPSVQTVSATLRQSFVREGVTAFGAASSINPIVTPPDASLDFTPSELLEMIKLVDGAASGLDADRLDGYDSSDFVLQTQYDGPTILGKLLTADGPGSGLDADLLDGLQGQDYARNKFYRHLSGLDPEKLSTNVLRLYAGSCAEANGSRVWDTGGAVIDINMAVVGVNGIDVGAPVNGVGYFPYVIRNNVTGVLAGVLSAGITYGAVVVPAGYTLVRKLPFGFVYNAAWDGIPNFYLTGWPKAIIRFTDAEEAVTWRALSAGASAGFVDVDTLPWVPDNARMVYFYARTSSAGAVAGYAKLRTIANNGLTVGASTPGALETYHSIWMRTTSTGKIQYSITNDARLTLFILGYAMTEPS